MHGVERWPNASSMRFELARMYAQAGKFDRVLEHATEAYRLNPEAPDPWIFRTQALAELGRYTEAEQFVATIKRRLKSHVSQTLRMGGEMVGEAKWWNLCLAVMELIALEKLPMSHPEFNTRLQARKQIVQKYW